MSNFLTRLSESFVTRLTLKSGLVKNSQDCARAARVVAKGGVVAFDNDALWLMVSSAKNSNLEAVAEQLDNASNRAGEKTLIIESAEVDALVDWVRVSRSAQELLRGPGELRNRFAGLCVLRIPVRDEAIQKNNELIKSISYDEKGQAWLSFFDPHGVDSLDLFVNELKNNGVHRPLFMSLRLSDAEVVNTRRAKMLARVLEADFTLVNTARRQKTIGNLPIITLSEDGVVLEKSGCISDELISCLVPELDLVREQTEAGSFLPAALSDVSYAQPPHKLREVTLYTLGWSKHKPESMRHDATPFGMQQPDL